MSKQLISDCNNGISISTRSRLLLSKFRWVCRAVLRSIPPEGPRYSHDQVGGAYIAKLHQGLRI